MKLDTIVCGDCLGMLPTIPDKSIDMVLADPPYGTTACMWDTIIPLEPMWAQLKRVTKPNGAIVMTASQPFTTLLIASNIKMFKYCWIWDKQSGGAFVRAKYRPLQTHEDIVVFGSGTIYYNPQMIDADAKNVRPVNKGSSGGSTVPVAGGVAKSAKSYNPHKRYPKTVISISRYSGECNSVNRIHPTQKPVALMEYLIKTYTNEGDTVLDFAIGSGTTAIAALKLNRHFYGCDTNREYVKLANERIEKTRLEMAQMEMDLTNSTNRDTIISNPRPTPGRHR